MCVYPAWYFDILSKSNTDFICSYHFKYTQNQVVVDGVEHMFSFVRFRSGLIKLWSVPEFKAIRTLRGEPVWNVIYISWLYYISEILVNVNLQFPNLSDILFFFFFFFIIIFLIILMSRKWCGWTRGLMESTYNWQVRVFLYNNNMLVLCIHMHIPFEIMQRLCKSEGMWKIWASAGASVLSWLISNRQLEEGMACLHCVPLSNWFCY